ncbi:hypothetical protein [Cupriavidus necator]|uniref:hypothetical protein n=1 Tax=Cupriavidus necator TaxID=106590 RepID=UPI00148F95C3|nr:hypothetical protein [Cupriavidus necator]
MSISPAWRCYSAPSWKRGWDADAPPPAGARLNAILSIAAWLLVICTARLIAHA